MVDVHQFHTKEANRIHLTVGIPQQQAHSTSHPVQHGVTQGQLARGQLWEAGPWAQQKTLSSYHKPHHNRHGSDQCTLSLEMKPGILGARLYRMQMLRTDVEQIQS